MERIRLFNIAVIRYYLLRPFTAQCSITLQFSISTDQLSSCPFEYAPPDRDVCSADSVSCHAQHRYAPLPRTRQVPPSLFFFNRQQLDNSCRFFYLQVLILCHPLVQCFHRPLFSFYRSGSYRKIIHKCSAAYNIRYLFSSSRRSQCIQIADRIRHRKIKEPCIKIPADDQMSARCDAL